MGKGRKRGEGLAFGLLGSTQPAREDQRGPRVWDAPPLSTFDQEVVVYAIGGKCQLKDTLLPQASKEAILAYALRPRSPIANAAKAQVPLL